MSSESESLPQLRLTDEGLEAPEHLVGATGTVVVEKPNLTMEMEYFGSGVSEFDEHLLGFPTDDDEPCGDVPPGCVKIQHTLYEVVDDRTITECPECGGTGVSPRTSPVHCFTCDTDLPEVKVDV